MRAMTLSEALVRGTGTERECLCPVHADTRPSCYVNVLKKVWYCMSCHASGRLSGKDLLIEPDYLAWAEEIRAEVTHRVYSESWLNQFDAGEAPHPYWVDRVGTAAVTEFRLGYDRERDAGTYPFRDGAGRVLGVVRRHLSPEWDGPKYLYPRGVDVSKHLFGDVRGHRRTVVLVEGALDAIAWWRSGVSAFAIYGSRFSPAQALLVERMDPDYVITSFDLDEAGWKAHRMVEEAFPHRMVTRLTWPTAWGKDVDEIGHQGRMNAVRGLLTSGILDVESELCESRLESERKTAKPSSLSTKRLGRMRIVPTPA